MITFYLKLNLIRRMMTTIVLDLNSICHDFTDAWVLLNTHDKRSAKKPTFYSMWNLKLWSLQKYLSLHGKALSQAQMEAVVSASQGGNPLFLKIIIEVSLLIYHQVWSVHPYTLQFLIVSGYMKFSLQELFRFGSFRTLDAKIDDLVGSKTWVSPNCLIVANEFSGFCH